MKLTSKQLAALTREPKKPTVKTRWKKCSYCEEEIKVATVTSLMVEGIYHAKCLVEIIPKI